MSGSADGDGPDVRVVVFLHGHDDAPETWAAEARALTPGGCALELPAGPLTTEAGRRSWFDSDDRGEAYPDDMERALAAVDEHLAAAADRHGVSRAQIAVVGFSQGAAVALWWALHRPGADAVGALVAVAGWVPLVAGVDPPPGTAGVGAGRLLVAHGGDDEVVPAMLGRSAGRVLERRGVPVTVIELDVGHDPGPFTDEIRAWLAGSPDDS